MYRQKGKSPVQSILSTNKSSSLPNSHSQKRLQSSTFNSSIDLRQFNDYLQSRITNSAKKNEQQMGRKYNLQKKIPSQMGSHDLKASRLGNINNCNNFSSKESYIKKSRESGHPQWKKHEPIQNLVNKQNNLILEENRRSQSENQDALRDLERKYHELQQKYKVLMKQATENAKAFEKDKKQLIQLKQIYQNDQLNLAQLKKELSFLQKNFSLDNEQSIIKIKSENNIVFNESKDCPVMKKWLLQDPLLTPIKNQRYKSSQNWTKNICKKALFQSQQKLKNFSPRYHSCEKQSQPKRQSKFRKTSDNLLESATWKKVNESMRGSRTKQNKPLTETSIRIQPNFSKNVTPNLQKKAMSSKQYNKYRFQPTYNL